MNLINISNKGRFVYLFTRDSEGKQKILLDKEYHPFYFEPDENGKFVSHDGIKLKKITCEAPGDIPKMRSSLSYASDIRYTIIYLINKVQKIEPAPIKIFYLDIEVEAPEMPSIYNPKYPISCITIYNNFNKEYKTWELNDYPFNTKAEKETQLLKDVVKYFQQERPDLFIGWNVEFDYRYMHGRVQNFAEQISPVKLVRAGKGENVFHPAGISIVDLKGLYEKFTLNKRRSYALDYIAQEDLGDKAWDKSKGFSKEKNINDVKRMVDLDEKFGIIKYFDEIRRFAKCLWEDLPQETIDKDGRFFKVSNNSKIIDSLLLQEGKEKGVVLPSKHPSEEKEEYDGAYRDVFGNGVYYNLSKFDLGSAYPMAIANFCLDPVNLLTHSKDSIPITVTDRETKNVIETYRFTQNENALLPSIVKKLMIIKDKLKKELGSLTPETKEYKELETKYNAIKSIVNSAYGVTGNRFFRLYDKRVAETITFLVRDLLEYVQKELESQGIRVIYVDTDSVFIEGKENISEKLNQIVQDWGIKKYGNKKVTIQFDYEGYFEKILILGKCHYYGYLRSKKGLKREIKGVEIKRSSSSKYEAFFQENLIEKILNKEERKKIIKWIKDEKTRIRTLPLEYVGFPSKIPGRKLLNYPIHIRAYDNTRLIEKNFKLESGDNFYYIFVVSLGKTNDDKPIDVLAFTEDNKSFIDKDRINWTAIIERNIGGKADKLFEAIGWKERNQPIVENVLFD